MLSTNNKSEKYIQAQKRVADIKQFYKHLIAYVLVNLFFIGRRIYKDIQYGDSFVDAITAIDNYRLFFWWGIALLIHAFNVFGKQLLFNKDWEARKIKEYMDKN